ncbi:MAG: hypothetical protein LUD51_01135 [Clostridia bacterium]|nr:hypothetical protein [Clostridia bacterium]
MSKNSGVMKWIWFSLEILYIIVWCVMSYMIFEGSTNLLLMFTPIVLVCPAFSLAWFFSAYKSYSASVKFFAVLTILSAAMLALILYCLAALSFSVLVIIPVVVLASFAAWYVLLCILQRRNKSRNAGALAGRMAHFDPGMSSAERQRMMKKILKILLIVIGFAVTILWYVIGCLLNTGRDSGYALFFIPEPVIAAGVAFAVFYSCCKSRKANIAVFAVATAVSALAAALMGYVYSYTLDSWFGSAGAVIMIALFLLWYVILCISEAKLLHDMHPGIKDSPADSITQQ